MSTSDNSTPSIARLFVEAMASMTPTEKAEAIATAKRIIAEADAKTKEWIALTDRALTEVRLNAIAKTQQIKS